MKLTKKYIKDIIDKNKKYLGFGDWKITVMIEALMKKNTFATAELDDKEKTMLIMFNIALEDTEQKFIDETIIHELTHARVCLMEIQYENLTRAIKKELEEHMVNDIVRWKARNGNS